MIYLFSVKEFEDKVYDVQKFRIKLKDCSRVAVINKEIITSPFPGDKTVYEFKEYLNNCIRIS